MARNTSDTPETPETPANDTGVPDAIAPEGSDDDLDGGGLDADEFFDDETAAAISEALDDDEDEDEDGGADDDDDDDEDDDLDDGDGEGDDDDDGFEDDDEDEDLDASAAAKNDDAAPASAAADPAAAAGAEPEPEAAAAAAAAAAGDPAAAAEPAAPTWELLSVKADKEAVAIDEAQITRHDGRVFVAIAEADFPRFQSRLSRGVVAEKVWRHLEAERQAVETERAAWEAERTAPGPKSDVEIEAEIVLEAIKPHLPTLMDATEQELLDAKVKLAQREARDEYAKTQTERVTKAREDSEATQTATQQEEAELEHIAALVLTLAKEPELQGLSEAALREVYDDLLDVKRSVLWKEGDEYFENRTLVAKKLKAKKGSTSAPQTEPPAAATPVAEPAATAPKTTDPTAERFNRGQATAARPGTTSMKARRGDAASGTRSRDERNTRARRHGRRRELTEAEIQAQADAEWRKTRGDFMRAPGLDIS